MKASLFDIRSIQKFIFSGNRLKTNIGASYLVAHVYEDFLLPSIEKIFGKENVDLYGWKENNAGNNLSVSCRVAYIGGGNALILYQDSVSEEKCISVAEEYTCSLLINCPGLSVGVAHGVLRTSDEKEFAEDISQLYRNLKKNQNLVSPIVSIPYTGMTMLCPTNAETANYCDRDGKIKSGNEKTGRFYSQETFSKTIAAEKANKRLRRLFSFIGNDFDFPMNIDQLGQSSKENYIAIIHIDGNNMGKKFANCNNIDERSRLSADISRKTEGCFGKLVKIIIEKYDDYGKFLDFKVKKGKKYLPIRPLILGGDDVTFICPAKIAIILAKNFIELMNDENSVPGLGEETAKKIDCCAGIGIFKTSYPFFRGYELAEQLCAVAKGRMRDVQKEEKVGSNWLDFALLHGEQAPTLEQIRRQEYSGTRGNMHFGPYRVGNTNKGTKHIYDLENLLEFVDQINSKMDKLPSVSKIKELRYVLQLDKYAAQQYMAQLKKRGEHLPEIKEWSIFEDNYFWYDGQTPYVDAIEMLKFIPAGV